jgi:hypothetical protein
MVDRETNVGLTLMHASSKLQAHEEKVGHVYDDNDSLGLRYTYIIVAAPYDTQVWLEMLEEVVI